MAKRKKTTRKVRAPLFAQRVRPGVAAKRPATHREPADEHAATELVMYIENTSDLSPDGPSGQGRSVLLNALRKWKKGTYDPEKAVKLFEYLAEAGAKRYAKEFDSEKNWATMFNPATRHEAAKQLEASFRNSVENGEYDHVDTRTGVREGGVEASNPWRDARGYQLIDEAEGKYGLERLSLEKISVGAPRRDRWVFAFRMGIDEQGIAKGGFHWVPADNPLEAERIWYEHTGRRVTLQQRAARRRRGAHEVRDPGGRMDAFTTAYFETALWSSTDNSNDQGGEPLDDNYSIDDIAPETRDQMIKDCADFQEQYENLMLDGTSEQGGHDFWLTRNRHGTGFWDGDWEHGDELTKAAHAYGSFDLYIGDDGLIYGQ